CRRLPSPLQATGEAPLPPLSPPCPIPPRFTCPRGPRAKLARARPWGRRPALLSASCAQHCRTASERPTHRRSSAAAPPPAASPPHRRPAADTPSPPPGSTRWATWPVLGGRIRCGRPGSGAPCNLPRDFSNFRELLILENVLHFGKSLDIARSVQKL